jgi:Kef-type K+ transport system membrane component KefB
MHTVILVLFEVLIVIGLSRLVGLAFRSIQQPLVIGEIVAGIMLGLEYIVSGGTDIFHVFDWIGAKSKIP